MAHYAKIENEIVTQVIVADQDFINSQEGTWVQTSYNTRGGIHYQPNSNIPSEDQSKTLRKNFAGIGHTYDSTRDAFIPPKLHNSWVLNETSCLWEAPVAKPDDGNRYYWDEETTSWVVVTS